MTNFAVVLYYLRVMNEHTLMQAMYYYRTVAQRVSTSTLHPGRLFRQGPKETLMNVLGNEFRESSATLITKWELQTTSTNTSVKGLREGENHGSEITFNLTEQHNSCQKVSKYKIVWYKQIIVILPNN